MPAKMTMVWPEIALARIRDELERELLAASDEEIMDAARELGMNPTMKGSAAFAGVKYPFDPGTFADFFGSYEVGTAQESAWLTRPSVAAPSGSRRRAKH
jgi:hypothetical protein